MEADKVVHMAGDMAVDMAVDMAGHLAGGMVNKVHQQNQFQVVQLQVGDIHHIQGVLMQVGDTTLPVQNKEVVLLLELVDNLSDKYVKSMTALIIVITSESTTTKKSTHLLGEH